MNEFPEPQTIFTDLEPFSLSKSHIGVFLIFFLVTPIILFSSIATFFLIPDKPVHAAPIQVYAALPERLPGVSGSVIGDDARVFVLQKYLGQNGSPLTPFAHDLVETADYYQLDWKLLPAIAQKESGLCRVIPEGSHNCWGWGITSAGTLMFDNYEEAISTVAKGLKEKYIDYGYVTPEEIMTKYAHPDSTTWADGVTMYINQIQDLSLE